jgi:hypothetical protein
VPGKQRMHARREVNLKDGHRLILTGSVNVTCVAEFKACTRHTIRPATAALHLAA